MPTALKKEDARCDLEESDAPRWSRSIPKNRSARCAKDSGAPIRRDAAAETQVRAEAARLWREDGAA